MQKNDENYEKCSTDKVNNKFLRGKPDSKRPLGNPRHKYRDNIKTDFK
jgi:hypothetical protein